MAPERLRLDEPMIVPAGILPGDLVKLKDGRLLLILRENVDHLRSDTRCDLHFLFRALDQTGALRWVWDSELRLVSRRP